MLSDLDSCIVSSGFDGIFVALSGSRYPSSILPTEMRHRYQEVLCSALQPLLGRGESQASTHTIVYI